MPPGLLGAECAVVEAIGPVEDVRRHPLGLNASVVRRPDSLLIPGLVNAHTHLDLSHIGAQPGNPEAGFGGFLELVRSRRQTEPEGIGESVGLGVQLSLAGGVVCVGDIVGAANGRACGAGLAALRDSPLRGVGFVEFFAIGPNAGRAVDHLAAVLDGVGEGTGRVRTGIQPHAPYSVSKWAYQRAVDLAGRPSGEFPLATHLAESAGERELIASGSGVQRAFLEGLGLWDAGVEQEFGKGLTPVEHLAPVLGQRRWLAAHVNQASDRDLDLLAASGATVVYCPRASAYFGAPAVFGGHRYRDMLSRGIRVALGTDSIINLHPALGLSGAGAHERLSTLDEMRLLFRRDATDPVTLLRMGTTYAGAALGFEEGLFRFVPGEPVAGVCAASVPGGAGGLGAGAMWERVLRDDGVPELLVIA